MLVEAENAREDIEVLIKQADFVVTSSEFPKVINFKKMIEIKTVTGIYQERRAWRCHVGDFVPVSQY